MMYILQLGNDQITQKATYYANMFVEKGYETIYLSEDRSGLSSDFIKQFSLNAYIAKKNYIARVVQLLQVFIKFKPSFIELYLSQRPWHLITYYLLTRLFGAKIYVWCRGELRNYNKHHFLRRIVNKFLLKNADYVILRELYMENILKVNNICPKKLTLIHNGVPSNQESRYNPNSKKLLFLNSFKSFRNLDFLIDSFNIVAQRESDIKLILVGSTLNSSTYSPSDKEYELMLRKKVKELNLEHRVEFHDFCYDRIKYFDDAFLYVLPADIVFLNYSLLESMSFGIPPLIIKTEGSDYIVDDYVDGFISEKDVYEFSQKIIHFFEFSKDEKIKISNSSMIKIKNKLSIESQFEKLFDFLHDSR